ncbi:diguanylate cyclase [Halobacillus sp. K22]|uniref:diguanylate cyclase n=1 Tax=Halobacillus sp. K22 TaxID=3457431 RepID=UPI003FCECE1E
MERDKRFKIWVLWICLWPSSIYLLYRWTDPPLHVNTLEIGAFVILASIVALFPLRIGDNPVFFTHGIAFAAFLQYGLFVEIIISQVSLLFLILKVRVDRTNSHRIPINFLMFLAISVLSAQVYYALGGEHAGEAVSSITDAVPIITYALSQILLNQVSLKIIAKIIYKQKIVWWDSGFVWDIATAGIVLPVGFVLYIVFLEFGVSAVFFVGIPFIFISGMLMLFHNSNEINSYLKKTSKIGHELTGKLGVKEVLDLFVERLSDLLPLDHIYVFDVASDNQLKLIRFFDRSGEEVFPEVQMNKGEGVSGATWEKTRSFHYRKRTEWKHMANSFTPSTAESVLSVPVERNDEIVGIITIYSNKKRAFVQFQFMILRILGNYLGVAIDNARHYEQRKEESERCPLTGLYNYRYFETYLQDLFVQWEKEENKKPISLILLDIDYFKQVNDTYGHESGNEILCLLSERLRLFLSNRGVLARYGGEEFVILLPGYSAEQSIKIAEEIKRAISSEPFYSHEHILKWKTAQEVNVTASIGVAVYPDDCESPLELIRHADRAMYIGAKQQGRNKVANYNQLNSNVQ